MAMAAVAAMVVVVMLYICVDGYIREEGTTEGWNSCRWRHTVELEDRGDRR